MYIILGIWVPLKQVANNNMISYWFGSPGIGNMRWFVTWVSIKRNVVVVQQTGREVKRYIIRLYKAHMYIQLCKIHNYFFKEKTRNRCVVEMLRAAVDQESEGAS